MYFLSSLCFRYILLYFHFRIVNKKLILFTSFSSSLCFGGKEKKKGCEKKKRNTGLNG